MGKRVSGRLTGLDVARASKRGLYGDGLGLYLQIAANGSKSWTLRYSLAGRQRYLGLGPTHTVTLAEARVRAAAARLQLLDGIDPITHRHSAKAASRAAAARLQTFDEVAEQFISLQEPGWKNPKLAALWRATLRDYASPVIGSLTLPEIDTSLVLKVLQPIWNTKSETAGRVRGRIEKVLAYAKSIKLREGENPAAWRGGLDAILPPLGKVKVVEHHAALPYGKLPSFMAALRERDATAARALEFLILTGARTGEVIGARWSEIDFDSQAWTVPKSRMKQGREHRVPLSDAATELLARLPGERNSEEFVFAGARPHRPLSNMALLILVQRRMGYADVTPHGFRATFKTWGTEQTSHPREIIEMALAHVVGNDVERAYQRGDALDKRRRLMRDWADFCKTGTPHSATIIPLRGA